MLLLFVRANSFFASELFTDKYLRGLIPQLKAEQEQRLQSMLDMDNSDIRTLSQHKDIRNRLMAMLRLWLSRVVDDDKTRVAKQLEGYFSQVLAPKTGECADISLLKYKHVFK